MGKYGHWTPRYLVNRLRLAIHTRRHKNEPWLAPQAVFLLDQLLRPTDHGLELGSGRSTLWFAKRLQHLVSIDHIPEWYERVRRQLDEASIKNVAYHLCLHDDADAAQSQFVRFVHDCPDTFDFVLIDGAYRELCANVVIRLLRPGGLLVLDNAHWYIDHPTRSPNSRAGQGHANEHWIQFMDRVANWRTIWTSNGVSDTALWFKPPEEPNALPNPA